MLPQKIEEGFRILTLRAKVDEDVIEFIRRYQVLASHMYWARRLGIKPSEAVMEKINEEVKSYWRWHIIDEEDPMYLFKGVEKTAMPHSAILRLPLVDALHERKGAYIKDGKLILRLNKTIELKIPEKALEWFNKRLAEKPDRKTVRVLERDGQLVIQVVLHKRNVAKLPEDPLLVVVDLNSSYGVVVHYWDGKLIKTEKYKPPNRGAKWHEVRWLMKLKDTLYNQATITQAQINTYHALIRKTLSGSNKAWIQQTVDRVVRRTRRMAKRHGKDPLVFIDVPDDESLRGTPSQRTIRSFAKYLINILSWYGIYWKEVRLYSTICPRCGAKLGLAEKTRHARIMACPRCGFKEDRDNIPLHWAINRYLNPDPRRGEASKKVV